MKGSVMEVVRGLFGIAIVASLAGAIAVVLANLGWQA
jgi:hypothetical protein